MLSTTHHAKRDRLLSSKPPALAPNSSGLFTSLMDTDSDVADVTEAISDHAIIVGKLIALANSAWSNPVKPITSVDEACLRLGLDVVRTVSIALAVRRAFTVRRDSKFILRQYWVGSVTTAQMAANLAAEYKLDSGSARAGGLLYNIGLLWLADVFPEEVDEAIEASENAPEISINEHLIQRCCIGYREASCVLMAKWGIPDHIIVHETDLNSHDDTTSVSLADVIYLASRMTKQLLKGNEEFGDCNIPQGISPKVVHRIYGAQRGLASQTDRVVAVLTAA